MTLHHALGFVLAHLPGVPMKPALPLLRSLATVAALTSLTVTACGGSDDARTVAPVVVDAGTPNTVSVWDETATATMNASIPASATPEERLPLQTPDLATVHIAMYDAVIAVTGGYVPFLVTPRASTQGASADAAAAAAAYTVLKALYPSRQSVYQPAYDRSLAGIADATARDLGAALGVEVGTAVVAARANDGRATALPPFVPGTAPGDFRGPALAGRTVGFVRPFAMLSATQFRAPGPPALTSATYAADFNETASLGGRDSTTRTAAQSTSALFQTENPGTYWPRNLRIFMMTNRGLAENARIGAVLHVAQADAATTCFESKYHFLAWRPASAIALADTDGNAATTADTTWVPFQATPPHPEYPAAHGCLSAAAAEAIRALFGTAEVSFDFSSTASASVHHYATTDELPADSTIARIAGGMHFRTALTDGQAIGKNVAAYVMQTRFQKR
jgi:hypothetical protein